MIEILHIFQAAANHRSCKRRVEMLEGPNGHVKDHKHMMDIVVGLYKNLFKREERHNISLSQIFWDFVDLVTESENESLIAPFSKLETKDVWSCYIC